jgi:hypothetical protein
MPPAQMSNAPMIIFGVSGSFKMKKDSKITKITLSLSIGATRETSPNCIALK